MSTPTPKSAHLTTRVSPRVRQKFIDKASQYGTHTEVLRELAEAFIEDRLIIKAPVTRKSGLFK